jgi:hypothetical protein
MVTFAAGLPMDMSSLVTAEVFEDFWHAARARAMAMPAMKVVSVRMASFV